MRKVHRGASSPCERCRQVCSTAHNKRRHDKVCRVSQPRAPTGELQEEPPDPLETRLCLRENQAASYVKREPGGTDPLGLSDYGGENAPSSETSKEEDPSWKVSLSEEEERRHPERSSWGGSAPPGGRTGGSMRRWAVPSSDSEEELQTEVEDVVRIGFSPGSTGRTARRAKQHKARRPSTEGSGNSSKSPGWGSAVHLPRSQAYEPCSPWFVPAAS